MYIGFCSNIFFELDEFIDDEMKSFLINLSKDPVVLVKIKMAFFLENIYYEERYSDLSSKILENLSKEDDKDIKIILRRV